MEKLTLDLKPKAFNALLKKLLQDQGYKVRVHIINSYKFPDCYVEVWSNQTFKNELRLRVFDLQGGDREMLGNPNNISYGNIQSQSIAIKAFEWVKVFETN